MSEASTDPGYAFMLRSVEGCFTESDLQKLIAAAADDQWLKDSETGAVRVMRRSGCEAGRSSRDPATWTARGVDGGKEGGGRSQGSEEEIRL